MDGPNAKIRITASQRATNSDDPPQAGFYSGLLGHRAEYLSFLRCGMLRQDVKFVVAAEQGGNILHDR